MATGYGPYVNNYWRLSLVSTVSSTSNTQAKVTCKANVNHKAIPSSVATSWNKRYDSGYIKIGGNENSWPEGGLSGAVSVATAGDILLKTYEETYGKKCSSYKVSVKGSNKHSSSGGASALAGTSAYTTGEVTIPARPKYTITFDRNGGSGGDVSLECSNCGENHKSYGYNSSVVTTTEPTKVGYTFKGWYTAESGGTRVTTITVNAATTYYAQWRPNIYYVIYNKNAPDAVGGRLQYAHTYDTSFQLRKSSFTRPGYRFVGWSDDPDSSVVKYLDQQEVSNLTTVSLAAVNLYAVWEPYVPNTYVRFNNKWVRVNKIVIKNKTDWTYVQKVFVKQNGLWVQLE